MHKLQVDPLHQPIRQKRRKFAPERDAIINDEVKSLLGAGFIREVQYPEWLANVVVVKKKNGKWRVCIDFTDLNKSCPKDPFVLPHIDKLVDSGASADELHGRILRLKSNTYASGKPGENILHDV